MKLSRLLCLASALVIGSPLAAQFAIATDAVPSGSPGNNSSSENVDFGDVDLDGDWDVVIADGGDSGNDQNRLWMNQGGSQGGGIGTFVDESAARFPAVLDQSRDIELADFDDDGDLDLYIANSSSIQNQSSRMWVNLGGQQGGALAVYVDETDTRWVGLGGPGSSVPATHVMPGGGFIDWAHDGEFGDIDNDGDLDLMQMSQGGAASGTVPTRLFLNDGDGYFSELNPFGVSLFGTNIPDGSPAIWCEGLQMNKTTDTTGAQCDIATNGEDADFGDIDGDFDLDILLGDRDNEPRMFANRLEGSLLAPASGDVRFRDVTWAVFLPGYSLGGGNYEQEFGDVDSDGDIDILAINWGKSGLGIFGDKVLENDGTGLFASEVGLAGSSSDDNEGDFIDYDSDGDLDLYIANWSGFDRLYRNDGAFTFVEVPIVGINQISLDADACDVDGDGDPDVMIAHDNNAANALLDNVVDVADVHAPVIPSVESVATGSASSGSMPVRAHVYDNAPYYVTYHADVALSVAVDGVALPPLAMKSSGGQVFRGELPANLVGSVSYHVTAADEYGNAGASAVQGYVATGDTGTLYGTASGAAQVASLTQTHAGMPAYLHASASPADLVFLGISLAKQDPPLGVPALPGMVLNIQAPLLVLASGVGELVLPAEVPSNAAGITLFAQTLAFDGAAFESSQGLELDVLP